MDDQSKDKSLEQMPDNAVVAKQEKAPSPDAKLSPEEKKDINKFLHLLDLACLSDSEHSKNLKEFISEFAVGPTIPETFLEQLKNLDPEKTAGPPVFKLGLEGQEVGHFSILEKLGAGGMGVVYKARDMRLGRLVAIKVLNRDLYKDETMRQILLREAQSAAKLSHPNITAIHDIGHFENRDFIVMEYVEGKSLRELIPKNGMPWHEARKVAKQIAVGLAEAHKQGIIHRDLKPDNVIVKTDGQVKILDFGLAKQEQSAEAESLAPSGAYSPDPNVTVGQAGTPHYMAPELLNGDPASKRSDVYAFGVTFYEMIIGKTSNNPLSFPSHLPNTIKKIILRCLDNAPDIRWADGQDLVSTLTAVDHEKNHVSKKLYLLFSLIIAFMGSVAAIFLVKGNYKNKFYRANLPNSQIKVSQLTAFSSKMPVTTPYISPDGKRIAFMVNLKLYIQKITSKKFHQVSTSPNLIIKSFSWYPNSQDMLLWASSDYENFDFWKFSSASGKANKLYFTQLSDKFKNGYVNGLVSPNGEHILVTTARELWLFYPKQKNKLRKIHSVINYPTEYFHQMTWSPDSQSIAYVYKKIDSEGFVTRIEMVDIKSKRSKILVDNPYIFQKGGEIPIAWLKNGSLIYAIGDYALDKNQIGLWSLKVDSISSRLPPPKKINGVPATTIYHLSSDKEGKRLIVLISKSQRDVYIANINPESLSNIRRITQSDYDEIVSDWYGHSLLINSIIQGQYSWYVQGISNENPRYLINTEQTNITDPTYSKNTNNIFFWQIKMDSSQGVTSANYMMYSIETKKLRSIFSPKINAPIRMIHNFHYKWHHQCIENDSLCLVSKREKNVLKFFKLDFSKGLSNPIGSLKNFGTYPWSLSYKGDVIAIQDKSKKKINIFKVNDGIAFLKAITPSFDCYYEYTAWQPKNNGLFITGLCSKERYPYRIFHLDKHHQITTVWSQDFGYIENPKVSPDGSMLAFSILDTNSNIWLLENWSE